MTGTFKSISIFAYDIDQRGNPVQAWETVVDESEEDAIAHATKLAAHHAGALVVKREGRPARRRSDNRLPVWRDRRLRLRQFPSASII
jgi:hypothetical protein